MYSKALLLASLAPIAHSAETVLGVYIFSRHGDRTSKSTPPTVLTGLGFDEVFTSGSYFRSRYIADGAPSQILGIESSKVKLSQVNVSAPLDNVLMTSATGFMQGVYPPVGSSAGTEKLANGTIVQIPLSGYQIIPIQQTTSGTGSEGSAWLQGSSNCANAIISSNKYFDSSEYQDMKSKTQDFYNGLIPMINSTFSKDKTSFKNAYTIFDYLNVASIHNETFPSQQLLTNDTFFQLRTLADNHEFNLAYNSSETIRAIAGQTLAAEVVQALQQTIDVKGKKGQLNVQFGAYGTFQSFFGLAKLTDANSNFYGIPDYASSMTFELFTTASADPFPSEDDLQVRFLFHNGTTSSSSTPTAYPLFGQKSQTLSWADFRDGMNKFAIGSQADWCHACGNTTGVCADAAGGASASSSSSGGISPAVGGVIGAMVTLAVILGIEAIILLAGGFTLVNKKRLAGANGKA